MSDDTKDTPPELTAEELHEAQIQAAAERTKVAVKMLRMCALSLARLLPTEQVEGLMVMATVGLVEDSWHGARQLINEGRRDLLSPQMIAHMEERTAKALLAMRGGLDVLQDIADEIASVKNPATGPKPVRH